MSKRRKIMLSSAVVALFASLFCGSANAGQEQATGDGAQSKSQAESETGTKSSKNSIGTDETQAAERDEKSPRIETQAKESVWLTDTSGLQQAIRDYLEQDGYERTGFSVEIFADQPEKTEVGSEMETEVVAETETETETEPQPVSRTASAVGYEDGLVYVKVTVDPDGTIADVEITDCSSQTDTIGQIAAPAVAKQIEKNQSVQVDGVTGATYTSDAVKEAAKKAIREAKNALRVKQ